MYEKIDEILVEHALNNFESLFDFNTVYCTQAP